MNSESDQAEEFSLTSSLTTLWLKAQHPLLPIESPKIKSHFITRRRSVRCPQRRFGFTSSAGCAENSARYGRLRRRQFLKDRFVEANSAFKIFERKIFVRRVCAAIGQP